MKFKTIIPSLLIYVCMINPLFAQTAEGDWYTPTSSKLMHLIISKDSISIRKCKFKDMKDYNYDGNPGYRIVEERNDGYIIFGKMDAKSAPTWLIIKLRVEGDRSHMNIESFDNEFQSLAAARDAFDNIGKIPIEIPLMNRKSVEKIFTNKDINLMTEADYKTYVEKVNLIKAAYKAQLKKDYRLGFLYSESVIRLTLADMGFNPFVNRFEDTMATLSGEPTPANTTTVITVEPESKK